MSTLREDITRTILRLSRVVSLRVPEVSRTLAFDPEGQELGSYRILRHLGAGGMGQVYLALDTRLGRHVALKFLSSDLIAQPEILGRLQMEAGAAPSLNHPKILTLYEISELGARHFIVSEYVEGVTPLSDIQRQVIY